MTLPTELAERARALAPDFELQREIGRGGMGVVYLAMDVKLDRPVAIKVLPTALAQSADVRERFLREARTAAKLSHPNIVPIYRADEMAGVVFFVMGYVDGPSLAERLAVTGALPAGETARVLRDVALALDYAHARGVIHRDIKPENILVERGTGRPLVTDFGIARLAEAAPLTQTGQVLGTVHYMSPEQVSGEPIDGRSDLYSLGVVGFRCLTGRLPFDNAMASAVLVSHVTKPAPTIRSLAPDVPPAIAAVFDRCLEKDPARRYASGAALGAALDEALKVPTAGPDIAAAAPVSPPTPRPTIDGAMPPVLSAREAESIWARAAELDAQTGTRSAVPRTLPPPVSDPTDPDDRRSLTSGYRFTDIRAAAEEAGISTRSVARAAEELGLATPAAAGQALAAPIEDRSGPVNRWVGSPTGISFEMQVAREATADDFEIMLDTIQRQMRDGGHASTLKHTLQWTSSAERRKVQIVITARAGRTTIRADERLTPLVGGIFGGVVGGGGGGISGLAMAMGENLFHSAAAGFGLWMGAAGAAYGLARYLFHQARAKREAALRSLVLQLAAHLAESDAGRLIGPPSPDR